MTKTPVSTRKGKVAQPDLLSEASILEEIGRLRASLAMARRTRDEARELAHPFELEFRIAHNRLVALPQRPNVSKETRLAAYDTRLQAGHAWHPYRQLVRDAERWIKACEEELKNYDL